jgi:hypothetical protein
VATMTWTAGRPEVLAAEGADGFEAMES